MWLAIGLAIYVFYSRFHSRLLARNDRRNQDPRHGGQRRAACAIIARDIAGLASAQAYANKSSCWMHCRMSRRQRAPSAGQSIQRIENAASELPLPRPYAPRKKLPAAAAPQGLRDEDEYVANVFISYGEAASELLRRRRRAGSDDANRAEAGGTLWDDSLA